MRRFRRFWIGALIAAAAITAAPAAGALAASAAPAAPAAAHVAAHGTTALKPAGNPAGCGTGNFCSYRSGNGGSICYNNHLKSISSWSSSCRTVDSVYNNGAAAGARLYYYTSFSGAWYCLGNGDYLLHMTANTFNQGSGLAGHGQPMDNHVRSSGLGNPCS
jgi:hypothetical protein